MPGLSLSQHGGNDKAWVWTTPDYAPDESEEGEKTPEDINKPQMFAIRFGTTESACPPSASLPP